MENIPGIYRLGLSAGGALHASQGRLGGGFRYEKDSANRVIPFDRSKGSENTFNNGTPRLDAQNASFLDDGNQNDYGRLNKSQSANSEHPLESFRRSSKATGPFVPPKFALAGQKLTFRGYFQEGVPESAIEISRKRHLIIQYFLEDDTVEIVEPAERNDGLPHGRFLKRMRLPDITVETLRIGNVIEVFSRAIRLYECDDFTRKFYIGLGMEQPSDEHVDDDAFRRTQRASLAMVNPDAFHGVKASSITRFIEAARGSSRTQSFKKDIKGRYLALDGIVLRFLVQWDDSKGNMFGDKHLYWMSYYLATEDAEIKEVKGRKQYRDWPTLLKRSRLPRRPIIHDDRMRSVEDVTGDEDYYNETDFRVGQVITVYGRDLLIADCDEFTHNWYMKHYNVDQKAGRIDLSEDVPPKPPVAIPPHIGIGTEEDTLESWKHLVPRAPRVDFAKLRNATGKTKRYLARLIASDPINSERVFRITIYLDDNHISVFEPKVRNSGIDGGVFQKKQRTRNELTGEYFVPEDIEVGREIVIKGHRMYVFEEERQPEPPAANVDQIIATLKTKLLDASASLRKMFRKFDTDKSQSISFEEFQAMLSYYSLGLSKYEAITLFKAFEDHPGFMSYANFMRAFNRAEDDVDAGRTLGVADTTRELTARCTTDELDEMIEEAKLAAKSEQYRIQQELLVSRVARAFKNSRTAQTVHENFRRFDQDKDHLISKAEFRAAMKRVLNLGDNDIDSLVDKFYAPGTETVNYEEFMSIIHEYSDKVIRS